MKDLLRKVKWDAILSALLYVVLGIVALVIPETMIKTLGYLIGIGLIVVGAVSMIGYLLRENSLNYYRHDFGYGLVGIAVGILFLYKVEWIISLVPVILGIMVLASGCGKLQNVIDMMRGEYGNWIVMLILAIINVVFGVILIVNPFDTVILLFQLVGVGLIFSGITDCFAAVYVAGRLGKFMNRMEAVDSSFVEVIVKENQSRRKQGEGTEEEQSETYAEKSSGNISEKVSDEGAEM